MNRVHHVMQTLPLNILHNQDYPNVEFILLDYNSSDELGNYIKTNLHHHLETGRLTYYKTFNPKYFHRSHSRNLLFKLANGEIVCNIDADNLTNGNFAAYVNAEFHKNQNIFLTTLNQNGSPFPRDVLGRLCLKKTDFLEVGGFDEQIATYGFEDYDLANRLEMSGVMRTIFDSTLHLSAITHKSDERLSNEYVYSNIHSILLRFLTPSTTDFIFLFNDGSLKNGILIDNHYHVYEQPLNKTREIELSMNQKLSVMENKWNEGKWDKQGKHLHLHYSEADCQKLLFNSYTNCYTGDNSDFYLLTDKRMISKAIMTYSLITNRLVLTSNLIGNFKRVNQTGFGNETVFRNFDFSNPIYIN